MFKCSFQTNSCCFLGVNIRNLEVKIQFFRYCIFENLNRFNNSSNVSAVLWYLNTATAIINVHRDTSLYDQTM